QRVEGDQRLERLAECVAMRAELVADFRKNAVDLLDFLDLQLAYAVAGFNRRRRLDEERPARSRCVLDDATHGSVCLASNRNHIAAIAHGHRHVGYTLMRLQLGHCALEKLDQLSLRSFELAANFSERPRCFVAHLSVLVDRALDQLLDGAVDEQRLYLSRQDSGDDWRRAAPQRFAGQPTTAKERPEKEEV